jgi:probable phosphoglycerate mutase
MSELFADVHVDKAVCSGFPRTLQTGEIILGRRGLEMEIVTGLQEIRHGTGEISGGYDICADVAFSHWRAPHETATFLGGERYHDFYARIAGTMEDLLSDGSWHNLAIFAHGGTNAAVLGWATGVGLQAFGLLDQAMCCLNVIDFDCDASGNVVRKVVRGMNITAEDPLKHRRDAGDMELLAHRLLKMGA